METQESNHRVRNIRTLRFNQRSCLFCYQLFLIIELDFAMLKGSDQALGRNTADHHLKSMANYRIFSRNKQDHKVIKVCAQQYESQLHFKKL